MFALGYHVGWNIGRSSVGRHPMGLQEWLLSLGIMSPGTCEKMGVLEKNGDTPSYISSMLWIFHEICTIYCGEKKTTCEFSIAMLVYQVVPRVFRSKAFFSQPWMTSVTFPWQTSWTSWFQQWKTWIVTIWLFNSWVWKPWPKEIDDKHYDSQF